MKMTKIESARIIKKGINNIPACRGVKCNDCFNNYLNNNYNGCSDDGETKVKKANAYIKHHKSKTKKSAVKTDVRDMANVVKDETKDPTPLEIAKAHVIKLICVDNQKGGDYLTIGKEYELLEESDFFYNVKNDKGYTGSYLKKEFTSPAEYLKDHSVDVKKVEPVGNTDKPVIEPLKFDDPVPEYVYMVTDKAIKREKVVSFLQTKDTFKITELIRFDYGGEHSFENCYKTFADAVKVTENKWGTTNG